MKLNATKKNIAVCIALLCIVCALSLFDISAFAAAGNDINVGSGYKLWACLGVLAVAFLTCGGFLLAKKTNAKNFIMIGVISVTAIAVVLVTNFQSAEQYYKPSETAPSAVTGTVTCSIRCDTIVGKSDSKYIPKDGIILAATEFDISTGDTVYDVFIAAARKYEIQMENNGSLNGDAGLLYISGINYLYEFQFGELSGWVYHVNGVAPSVGCGEYTLTDGDVIEWLYTCDLGDDVK